MKRNQINKYKYTRQNPFYYMVLQKTLGKRQADKIWDRRGIEQFVTFKELVETNIKS